MAWNTSGLESLLKACVKGWSSGTSYREMVNSLEMSIGNEGMLLK